MQTLLAEAFLETSVPPFFLAFCRQKKTTKIKASLLVFLEKWYHYKQEIIK